MTDGLNRQDQKRGQKWIGYPGGILIREDCEKGVPSPSLQGLDPAPGEGEGVFVNGILMMARSDYEWVNGCPVFKFKLKALDRVLFQLMDRQQDDPKETPQETTKEPRPQRLMGYLVMASADCEGRTSIPSFVATSKATLETMGKKEHYDYLPSMIPVYIGDVTLEDLKRWRAEDAERDRKIDELQAEIERLKQERGIS